MGEPRDFPYARWPRVARSEVLALRRAARRLPVGAVAGAAGLAQGLFGLPLGIEPLPIEQCPRGELRHCLSDPLCAAILEPAAPIRGARIALEIEPRFAAVLIDRVLGGTGEGAPTDPGPLGEVEKGVLAYALARALAASGGGALRLAAIVTTPTSLILALGDGGAICWPARARLGADAGIVRAWIPDAVIDRADPAPLPGAHVAILGALAAVITVEAGRATLSAADVSALAPGDVVVLDEALARRDGDVVCGEISARARGGATRWRCAIDGARLVVRGIEPGRPAARPMMQKEERMEADDDERARALLRAAGDAPIELIVELARFEMPFSELAALRPGEVLATGSAIGQRVTLRAGDRIVATGELVDIEGEVGVRVLSLP